MSDKLAIPQVIRDAVHNALASYPAASNTGHAAEIACEAFARALKEHPCPPTWEQVHEMQKDSPASDPKELWIWICAEWPRCMFDAPEPEVPDGIRDMMLDASAPDSEHCFFKPSVYNERIIEAYRRGKESREP